ncbi:ABC transporter ATP binding subunit [Umezakia ovalisporum]|jgi:lipopolysaccharide transport system ATP-binding protein|nr:ABC transporter ATP binding subunit [Umezakia ovalisporum]
MMTNLIKKEIGVQPQDSALLIKIDKVSKKFCRDLKQSLFYGVQDIGTELVGGNRNSASLRKKEFWALKDVSFKLHRGEALGLVGSNGAGKSTLLRIISGLIKPDTGRVEIRGRIAPLIALGAGFNPILTGRENIYANMSILGLSKEEIEERFADVIDFSEIGDAIDAPVQTYSSGMAARLGFACAVHIEPDILLIDEVLAVGDIKFKIKCHHRLALLREKGTAFILVSHNQYNILNVCETSLYLSKGQLILAGKTETIIRKYEEDLCLQGTATALGEMILPQKPASESLGIDILSVCFQDEEGNLLPTLTTGKPACLSVKCQAHKHIKNLNLGFLLSTNSEGQSRILTITSASDNEDLEILPGISEIQMQMSCCSLIPGMYSANIYLKEGIRTFDKIESFRFVVKSDRNTSQCLFYQPHSWKVINH